VACTGDPRLRQEAAVAVAMEDQPGGCVFVVGRELVLHIG
jgi:hypothetical protein